MSIDRSGLSEIFSDHIGKVTDKWAIYVPVYERCFSAYRDKPVRLLEIGIQNGGSLEIWGKYFVRAKKLVGCDIDQKCRSLDFENKKISVIVGDANSDQVEKLICAKSKDFDLVIDDGSHRSSDIVRSFTRYFKYVNDGGLYVAEDLHCSYWQQFEGGIFQPLSSISFFKSLADVINHQHWGVSKTRTKLLANFNREYEISLDEETLCHIHSIEFINSMCVIRKFAPSDNHLGSRIVAGTDAVVDSAPLGLHGSLCPEFDQSTNAWSEKELSVEQELAQLIEKNNRLNQLMAERELDNSSLKNAIKEHKADYQTQNTFFRSQHDHYLRTLADRDAVFSEQIQQIQTAHEQEKQTQAQQHLLRVETLNAELNRVRLDADLHVQSSDKCEAMFKAQLHEAHLSYAAEKQALILQHGSREEASKAEILKIAQDAKALLQQTEERELFFSEQMKSAQLTYSQEKDALDQKHKSRQGVVLAELSDSREQVKFLQRQIEKQESALSAQLKNAQLIHEQLITAQELVKAKSDQLAERELEFSEKVSVLQRDATTEKAALMNAHAERTNEFARALTAERVKRYAQEDQWFATEQQIGTLTASLLNQITFFYEKRGLQLTSIFRRTNPVLDLVAHAVDEVANNLAQSHRPYLTNETIFLDQSEPLTNAAQNIRDSKMTAGQSLQVAKSLDELLALDHEEFVSIAYQTLLARKPDHSGFKNYLARLNAGTSKYEIITQLRLSKEGTSNGVQLKGLAEAMCNSDFYELMCHHDEPFVRKAYALLLGRDPDPEGLHGYLHQLREGAERINILQDIRDSSEAKSRHLSAPGLNAAITNHQRGTTLLIRVLLGLPGFARPLAESQRKVRALKNQMYALNLELKQIRSRHLEARVSDVDTDVSERMAGASAKENAFDAKWRVTQHPEAVASGINAKMRYSNWGKEQSYPPFFDAAWYLEQNPDISIGGMDPYEHYISHGKKDGRHPMFDDGWYLSEYPDVKESGMNPREHYIKHGKAEGRHPAFDEDWYLDNYPDVTHDALEHYLRHGKLEGRHPAYSPFNTDRNNYPKWILKFDTLTSEMRAEMYTRSYHYDYKPLISIVMPVYNPNTSWLEEAIESVRKQIYQNWELCIADDASTNLEIRPILERYASKDKRIKVTFREKNGHISEASNSALSLAQGEWIALLDHDDLLSEHAIFWVVDAINKYPEIRLIYSDEDKIDENGVRSGPYFKCDWNPDLFYSHNLITHLGVYHAELINKIEGFRVGVEGSQDYDLALRFIEEIEPSQIHHVPRILYHWRMHAESTAQSSESKPYAMIAGERAINEHFQRLGVDAKAELEIYGYRVRYALPQSLPLVSLIIPTRNGLKLLEQCIESILTKTTYSNYEVLVVDNGSDDSATLLYLQGLAQQSRIRVIKDNRPFNYSALNNSAVKSARGEIVGLINNDIEVISPDWLSEMVSHVLRPEVGAVGARLWYADNTLQHGGIIVSLGGVAGHSHKHLEKGNPGYQGRATLTQSVSAVTGACLIIRKSIFDSLGGLNESDLQIAYNDVDFCLRVREAGYRNIWTPYAELYHYESASRGYEDTPEKKARFEKETSYMQRRWGKALHYDPAYSPNLTLAHEDFSFAWPPRVESLTKPNSAT